MVPRGKAAVRRPGGAVTIVAVSRMVHVALEAAQLLAADGIEAEVIDPRTLVPLDIDALVGSVKRTNRALVVDGGHIQFGVTGEIAASIAELAFDYLDAPVMRIGAPQTPIPVSRSLEPLVAPDAARIADRVRGMFGQRHTQQ